MKYYLFVFLSVLLFLGCQEKKIDLDGVWVNDGDDRYYFCADTFGFTGGTIGHEQHSFRIDKDKFIVELDEYGNSIKYDFKIINNDSIEINRPNGLKEIYCRINYANLMEYQLSSLGLGVEMIVDNPFYTLDVPGNIIISNDMISDDRQVVFYKGEEMKIDSLMARLKNDIFNIEKRLWYKWSEFFSMLIDRNIKFEIYNKIRKKLLAVREEQLLTPMKIGHIYKNSFNHNKGYCVDKYFDHSVVYHQILSSGNEKEDFCKRKNIAIEPFERFGFINIQISETDKIIIDKKEVKKGEITNLLYSKYVFNPKKTLFIIRPSPKSTYGKYLFIRNRILDCVNKAKQEYPIGEYENFPFDLEKWQKDSLNQLFPLYEELGEFKN